MIIFKYFVQSPILNSWFSNIVIILSSLIAIPIVITKLNMEEINFWFLITTISSMSNAAISGINSTFVRFIAYSSAGIKIKDFRDIKNNILKKESSVLDSLELSKIFHFMKITYFGIAIIYLIILIFISVFILKKHILLLVYPSIGWLSWIFVAITIILTFVFGYFQVFLEGMNKVALVQRIRAIVNFFGLFIILFVLFTFPNLLSIVMVYQVISLILLGVLVYFGIREVKSNYLIWIPNGEDQLLKNIFWEIAWKSGYTSILASISKHVSALLVAQFFSTSQSASFLLVKRFFDVLEGFTTTTFYSRIPKIAQLRGSSNFNKLIPFIQQTQYISFGIFLVGYSIFLLLGNDILAIIHSKVDFGSVNLIILFSVASFLSRYSGISMAIVNQANHIVEHINTTIFAIVYFLIIYYCNKIGVIIFPIAQIIAIICAMFWIYKSVYNSLHTNIFSYEKKVIIPIFCILLIINSIYLWSNT